jgi:hypothetical protein
LGPVEQGIVRTTNWPSPKKDSQSVLVIAATGRDLEIACREKIHRKKDPPQKRPTQQ